MADKKKMSVAEIMAAARKQDAKGGAAASAAPTPAEPASSAEAAGAAPEKPAAQPAKTASGGGRLSVAEILAQARANKGEAAPAAAPATAPAPSTAPAAPAPKPVPAKTAAEKPVARPGAASGAKDTASILAAARKDAKPGPVSKAQAARLKPEGEAPKAKGGVPPMPPKPAYAKPDQARSQASAAPAGESRRFFLATVGAVMFGSFLAIGFTSMAATFGLWLLGTARFMFPNILTEPPSKFKVGFPGDFPPGAVEEKFKALFGIWIARAEYQGQMQIYALRTVCTHLGCTPNWLDGEQKFKCPCHGSGFYKDGINFEGPAPRPLERYAISIASDGQLEVDKSKLFQEEMGQWSDAASFVPG